MTSKATVPVNDSGSGISKEIYFSSAFADIEEERLWPRTWLMAGRVEDVAAVGDFITFEIARESILVLRESPTSLKAFHNVCQHRARKLKEGCGNTGRGIICPFHGWRYGLNGVINRVTNSEDWNGSAEISAEEASLKPVRLDVWGGWIFICMDPSAPPLAEYLAPVRAALDPLEFHNCRLAWQYTVTFPSNWKVAINFFNEAYHVETAHSQVNRFGRSKTKGSAHGIHSSFGVMADAPGARFGGVTKSKFADRRELIMARQRARLDELHALVGDVSLAATQRLVEELPEDASPLEIVEGLEKFQREEAAARRIPWPQLDEPALTRAGIGWHLFPNFMLLLSLDGALTYRSRPVVGNPEACTFEISWLPRCAPDAPPTADRRIFPDVAAFGGMNFFLEQDFANLASVQEGMHSRGYSKARLNPVQEKAIDNFERALVEFVRS